MVETLDKLYLVVKQRYNLKQHTIEWCDQARFFQLLFMIHNIKETRFNLLPKIEDLDLSQW